MLRTRSRAGALLAAGWLAGPLAAAPPPAAPPAARPAAASPLDCVAANYRDAVADVLQKPTVTGQATDEPFSAHPQVFDWLLDHPDRASLAWRRMGVPCVPITAAADGRFEWADDKGSAVSWRPVGRTADRVVWFAAGTVKPGLLMPPVPVKAVAVFDAPRQPNPDGTATFTPAVRVCFQTDSRPALAALRLAGPAVPRMADQGASQLLLFFRGPARYLSDHPDRAAALLAPAGKKGG